MEPYFVLVLDVVEPYYCLWFLMLWNHILFGSNGIEPLFIGGIRGATMPDVIGIYFGFKSGDLASTSSLMCGSWNLHELHNAILFLIYATFETVHLSTNTQY